MKFVPIIYQITALSVFASTQVGAQMEYDKSSYEPVCDPIKFRSATNSYDGKSSTAESISVSGGGWNKVHCEITSRTLKDGDSFVVKGNRLQVGAGLCIETCELEEGCSIRFNHNCVGFYGDNSYIMFAADENGKEYKIQADIYRGSQQGFTYNEANNCVTHVASYSKDCIPLPDHFKGKPLRAIGQVWNSATATVYD